MMKAEEESSVFGSAIAFLITMMVVVSLAAFMAVIIFVKLINPPHGRKNNDARMTQGKEAAVMYAALGDSTGAGVGAREGGYPSRLLKRLDALRPGSKLTNVCVSGATTDDVLRGQVEPAIASRPTLITLGIGINDVGRGMNVGTFARNYEKIVNRLKEANAPIVITNIPDVSLAPVVASAAERDEYRRRIELFNERISDIASRHNLLMVDAYAATREIIPRHPEFFSDDGFHPSDKGYEYWAEVMWPTVKKAVEERLCDL